RKASNVPSVKQAEERARKEAEKAETEELAAQAAQAELEAETTGTEAQVTEVASAEATEGEAVVAAAAPIEKKEEPVARRRMITGKSIVGKIDLSRASRPPGRPERSDRPGGGGRFEQNRTGGERKLRPGFVKVDSAKMPIVSPLDDRAGDRLRKDDRTKRKFGPGTGGATAEGVQNVREEEPPVFEATEFRKREVVFQPKKKKVALGREMKKTMITTPSASKRIVKVEGQISVPEFAKAMSVKVGQLIGVLVKNGVQATIQDNIDAETATLIAPEFGFEVQNVEKSVDDLTTEAAFGDLSSEAVIRPPIVTVMGHVDHGKTTLLDTIRKTSVVKGEAGGITQHIGAYSVKVDGGKTITFIDTPGHEAFTAMRARGANVTDIVIIVVAADDGVMPQTAEAINHAKAAGVPIIVAVNKMDRPGANPERIKQQMTEFELVSEEWGGTTIFAPVSALNGDGVPELLESLLLTAEVSELKANPKRSATGIVIEAQVKKGRGNVATLLVRDGTMKVGQSIVAGKSVGRIRAMINDKGENVKEAGPSTPVEVLGLETTPGAGDRFDICENDAMALKIAKKREELENQKIETPNSGMSLDALFSKVKSGDVKELPLVIKTDVSGSGEAIRGMLEKANTDAVKVKIVHNAVGGISESDVLLAGTAGGLVIGFNVRPDGGAQRVAKQRGIEIKCYSIVYELMDDIEKAMKGMLAPEIKEQVLGMAEVRNTFVVPKMGTIAGCFVTDGKLTRNAQLRLVREGRNIYEGKVSSLKRFKDDVKEVNTGFECGVGIENFNDIKVGDVIEAFEMVEVRA
ncbi:MAG: translation initiation factor IF-2, partial [Bdellovibrionales bacterium]|nr:translation initiation factor IF-2 [Bdellovibrionales bacterium]